jgi:probable F420-dependent oxidoreductase
MKIHTLMSQSIVPAREEPRAREQEGYSGVWIGEAAHDPWLQSLLAIEATERATVGTAVAIAFARNPMIVAATGYDLSYYSQGRFMLGLGTQIQAHIERRYSMPWSHPTARIAEFIDALRAIWHAWTSGEELDFQGQFYNHTLMTPVFTPARHDYGPPPIYLAGVGPAMLNVAASKADGLIVHPFHSAAYLSEVVLPVIESGAQRSGRDPSSIKIGVTAMVATGSDEIEYEASVRAVRDWLSFYGSTPAYRPVLEMMGYGDLQPRLKALSKLGKWEEMSSMIPDELLEAIAIVGEPHEIAKEINVRYVDVADHVTVHIPGVVTQSSYAGIVKNLERFSIFENGGLSQ